MEAAKAVVKKLTVPFSPKQICNPVLQRQYAMLEALALNRESVEEVPDHTGKLMLREHYFNRVLIFRLNGDCVKVMCEYPTQLCVRDWVIKFLCTGEERSSILH